MSGRAATPVIQPGRVGFARRNPAQFRRVRSRTYKRSNLVEELRMTVADWLMIIVVLLAPIIAVQVQKYLELIRERRNRKLHIFYTLMATRAARTSMPHVEALNRIDLEYRGHRSQARLVQSEGERSVSHAWNAYRDHLNTQYKEDDFRHWVERGDELFGSLLYCMGNELNYDFDKVQLQKGVYSPKAHGDEELYQRFAKAWFVDIAQGKKSIPINIVEVEAKRVE